MLKHIKNLLKANFILIAIGITISIIYLSLIKAPNLNIDLKFNNIDKIYHAIAYFSLAFSWLFTFRNKKKKNIIILGCIFFGIIIEILQNTLTNYRTAEYLDIVANLTGIFTALILFNLLFKKKNIN
ncbi:VanZ family protein [uncultured Polaribacter sp.]|uniref:VanZ family protein n=1 Tax=uncultured Polaribacter sp. TaxID=174711 RepID=UPI002637DC86|nr:VanZ family protein [uncultured Polaribacter sp.]